MDILWLIQYDNKNKISLQDFRRFINKLSNNIPFRGKFNFNDAIEYFGISLQSIPQYSYVIDGGDRCHFTKWSPLQENGMIPILVPNIGFKQFSEIKGTGSN